MKIGVTSTGENLDSEIDQRFGRCKYFIIVETESMEFETISNENAMTAGGAGIQAAQTIAKKGVQAVITGNVGPNAFQTLSAAGIRVYTNVIGSVREAIDKCKNGALEETKGPNVASHSGARGLNP